MTYGQVVAQMAPGRCGIVVNTPMRARSNTHLVVGSIPPPVILSFDLLPLFPHSVTSPFTHFPIRLLPHWYVSGSVCSCLIPTCFCLAHRMVMSHSHVVVSRSHAVCTASGVYIDWGRAGDSPHRLIPCPTRPQRASQTASAIVVQQVMGPDLA